MNLFAPLLDSVVNCISVCMNKINSIPTLYNYTPNNTVYMGSDLHLDIGVTYKKEKVQLVLNDSNPNLLISGVCGSGKSVCLNSIINEIVTKYPHTKIYCFDYKIVELAQWSTISQCEAFCYEEEDILETLTNILDNIRAENKQLLSIGEVRAKPFEPCKIIIIEELAIASKKVIDLIANIASIGRSLNYRVICTCQRASANDILSPKLRALLTNRICFKTVDEANSKLVIDSPLASYINIVGRGYYSCDNGLTEFQGAYINQTQIKETVNKNCKRFCDSKSNIKAKPKNIDNNSECNSVTKCNTNTDWLNKF